MRVGAIRKFKQLAGALAILFGGLTVLAGVITVYQAVALESEVSSIEESVGALEYKINSRQTDLDAEAQKLAALQSEIVKLAEECVEVQADELNSEPTMAAQYCVDFFTQRRQARIDNLTSTIVSLEADIAESRAEIAEENLQLLPLQTRQAAVIPIGGSAAVTLLAVWGAFALAFLWGSHKEDIDR